MSLDSVDGCRLKDIPLYKIRSSALWRKKETESKILPIDPNYPIGSNYKIGTVFPRKNVPKKHKIPPKAAKALIVYIIIILTILVFQTPTCGKPPVGWPCPRTGEGQERHQDFLSLLRQLKVHDYRWHSGERRETCSGHENHWILVPTPVIPLETPTAQVGGVSVAQ